MNKNIFNIFIIAILILFSFTGCERDPDIPPLGIIDENKILTVSDIYKIYADSVDGYTFRDNYMLYGAIIMDDNSGNIYRESYIQDTTGGINLYGLGRTGVTQKGTYVRINLKGASIVYYSGKMELDFRSVEDFRRQIVIIRQNYHVTPAEVTIENILNGDYDCELVKIKNVQFAASDTSLTYATVNGTFYSSRKLENCDGRSVITWTNDKSDFAGDPIAKGNGDITGVITKHIRNNNTEWQLLINQVSDIELNGERCPLSNK